MNLEPDNAPYVGLRPFSESEHLIFFGRERELRVVFSNLSTSSLTVLYGPSGTGKSSLLRAGLIPMVRSQWRRTAIVYFNQWQGGSLLERLKEECLREARRVAGEKQIAVSATLPLDELLEALEKELRRPLLIVLDQFE